MHDALILLDFFGLSLYKDQVKISLREKGKIPQPFKIIELYGQNIKM